MRDARPILAIAVMVTLVSGCSGSPGSAGSSSARDAGSGSPSLPPLASCPTPTRDGSAFPPGEPSRLPHPAFATSATAVPVEVAGVQLLKFTTAMSLRDAVIFVTEQFPEAGWVIGDGDAEGHEADVPFSKGTVHGKLRLSGLAPCTTTWLVQTVTRPGADVSDAPGLEKQ